MKIIVRLKWREKKVWRKLNALDVMRIVKFEEIIDYDDYRIVAEDGMVYTYTCPECDCYIQVFVNDK